MVFCQKPEKRQADACIQGYTYMPGQLSGQQFLTVTIQSMKECGTKCEKDARCNSYEYSYKYKRCELNNNPTTNVVSEWYDMKFCQKAEEDREALCSEAYTETEGISACALSAYAPCVCFVHVLEARAPCVFCCTREALVCDVWDCFGAQVCL